MSDTSGFTVQHKVEYARHDGVALHGSFWRPKGDGPFPVLICIHGGGWQQGGPDNYEYWGEWLAPRGWAVFAISYRYSSATQKSWPECFLDCRAAVQYVRGKAVQLGVDPDRISLMGDSAGGYLSALVALAGERSEFANRYPEDEFARVSTRVKAVVGNYGIYDLYAQWLHDQPIRPNDHIVQKFMGFPPMQDRRAYIDASPMTYVETRNVGPSFYLMHGNQDDVVHYSQTDDFHFALRLAGFYTRRLVADGAGHYFVSDPIDEPGSRSAWLAPRVLRFLQERG